MIGFELHLIEIGYSVFHYKKNIKTKGYEQISTMVNLCNYYEKDNVVFCIGLNEKDKPITIISPRPNRFVFDNGNIGFYSDDEMNKKLNENYLYEVYDFCIKSIK